MPNLQTPTGVMLSPERRQQVADILRKYDAYVIEDDVFSFLCPDVPLPISELAPERSFYLTSFAKCIAPGLRVGAVIAPSEFRDRLVNGLRSTGWMATPIMVEATARLIRNGQLAASAAAKREQAAVRHAMAREIFAPLLHGPPVQPAFHIWLPLPQGRAPTELAAAAAVRGVQVAPPNVLPSPDPVQAGIRICLGCTDALDQVRCGLEIIAHLLDQGEVISHI
jgi:DNA-binding transcriptional MocR family regulator